MADWAQLRGMFHYADKSGDGEVDAEELAHAMGEKPEKCDH